MYYKSIIGFSITYYAYIMTTKLDIYIYIVGFRFDGSYFRCKCIQYISSKSINYCNVD